jgi:predicted DNA-binding protein (UPF0251 family)
MNTNEAVKMTTEIFYGEIPTKIPEREVLVLVDLKGHTENEAAKELGITQQAVHKRRIKKQTYP